MKKYNQNCKNCGIRYTGHGKYYCSSKCQPRNYDNGASKIAGEKHYNWKGDDASYHAKHLYLKNHFGKASTCENKDCKYENPKRFEWALRKGSEYTHKREDYLQLCKSCHLKYDEVHFGEKSVKWKGGKPKCKNCSKELSTYKNKTSLCGLCNRKINPPWLGKKRK